MSGLCKEQKHLLGIKETNMGTS